MMTIQAREHFAVKPGKTLRDYPVDSPRAKARLIALALLADGKLDAAELDGLRRRGAFRELGIAQEDFYQVLYDFCSDVTRVPAGSGDYLLAPELLEDLFGEVQDPAQRQVLLHLIFDVIRSDGRLALGESRLFWNAIDAWNLRVEDGRAHHGTTHGGRRHREARPWT
jgi:hypothetical protein